MNSTQNTSIQSQDHKQIWARFIHSRLAVQAKAQGKQRCRNTWHTVKYWCHANNYQHTRLHDSTWVTTGNVTRWVPAAPWRTYHQRLAREQRSNTTRHEDILDILRWYGSDWWSYSKLKVYSDARIITKTCIVITPCKSYGNWKK